VDAPQLATSAYVVLGLLATFGQATPYDLKRWVDGSIGYFWSFPRAQLYVEPERLVHLGLLSESREATGRRRRLFCITAAGRGALQDWIRDAEPLPVEIRDPGLLKLYFAREVSREDVAELARVQQELHTRRLREYQRLLPTLERREGSAFARATLRLGLLHEQLAVEFWADVASNPP
jgi:DNA-binding PadR family transcriptional regulator